MQLRSALHLSPLAKRCSRMTCALLLIPLLAAMTSAQTFRGTILGTVTDPNGAVVPGATVTVKNTNTGLERSTSTDEAGNYTVAELPIGPYEVRVQHTGFVASVVSNVTVEVASERRVDVKLNVSGGEDNRHRRCRRASRNDYQHARWHNHDEGGCRLTDQRPRLHEVSGHGPRCNRRSFRCD